MSGDQHKLRCPACAKEFHPNFRICPNCGAIIQKDPFLTPSGGMANPAPPPTQPKTAHTQSLKTHATQQFEPEWSEVPIAPWRRWAARTLDITFNSLIMGTLIGIALFAVAPYEADAFYAFLASPSGMIFNIMLGTLLGCTLTGLIIGSTGSSIGKYLFGIRVSGKNGLPIGASNGLMRDLEIWLKGLGMGIPVVALFTQIFSYRKLRSTQTTSWDDGKYQISYRQNNLKQKLLSAAGVTMIIVVGTLSRVLMEV